MALSPQWLDQLRSRITLSALIGRSVKLQRAGREHRACCPFHQEKSPSFYVNDERGFYHCFGCQAHGGAIDWLMHQQGLSFLDAVKELAAQAGMDVPAPDPREAHRQEQRAGLHEVCAAAQEWFVANLAGPEGAAARDYLRGRGIDAQAGARFGFGYAPEARQALGTALARFGEALLIEAGLRIAVEGKEPYDRFRERLTLPIADARGRVIGFGGRLLQAREGVPKYLNSPDTPLFDKGRVLYNLHRAAPAARSVGRVIAVEGYMDVVALACAGIAEAVAPMGTALTEAQLEGLWRLADRPILCFDGDAAGRRAAVRAAQRAMPLLRPGRSLAIVALPAGLDPDDVVRREGAAGMERLLASPLSLAELIWDHEVAAAPLDGPEAKAGLKARLLGWVGAIADRDIAALYRRDLLDRYGALAFPQRSFAGRTPGGRAAPVREEQTAQLGRRTGKVARAGFVAAVLHGFARHPECIPAHADTLLRLAAEAPPALAGAAEAIEALLDFSERLESDAAPPISPALALPPSPDLLQFSFLREDTDPAIAQQDLAEAVELLVERPALDAAIAAATRRFAEDPEGAFSEQQRLRKRKLEIERRLGQMARQRAADASPASMDHAAPGAPAAGQQTD